MIKVNLRPVVLFLLISSANAAQPDPYNIFLNYYHAVGGLDKLKAIKTTYSKGRKIVDQLKGHFEEWSEVPIRYKTEENYTIFTQSSGDNGLNAWSRDFNNNILIIKDQESRQRREINKLLSTFKHIQPNSNFFTLSYHGQIHLNGKPSHTVKLTNRINKDIVFYYFDINNYLLIKTIEKQADIEIHTHYQDYRLSNGNILIPFRTESESKPRNKHETIIIDEFHANPTIPDNHFEIPSDNIDSIHFKQQNKVAKIPFQLNDNLIYVAIQLQGQETLWIIDSGASHSLIDEEFAKQLGLVIHPGIKGFGFGGLFDLSYVKLPSYGFQSVQIENQTIYALKGFAKRFSTPQAMGILGYDFLSHFVVKINYSEHFITLYDNKRFHYNGNADNIINAPLKYNTFSIPVVLDKKTHGYWSVDLGAYDSSLHYSFAKNHHLLQRKGLETISAGINNIVLERSVKFDSLSIGPHIIQPAYINIPVNKDIGTGAISELAGNIGNSILRHFIIYLDYKNQQVILEPGKEFNKAYLQNLTGLTIGYSDTEKTPFIAHVSPDSPAAESNLKIGDDIVAINTTPTIDIGGLNKIREFLLPPLCKNLQLTVRRNNEIYVTGLACK